MVKEHVYGRMAMQEVSPVTRDVNEPGYQGKEMLVAHAHAHAHAHEQSMDICICRYVSSLVHFNSLESLIPAYFNWLKSFIPLILIL